MCHPWGSKFFKVRSFMCEYVFKNGLNIPFVSWITSVGREKQPTIQKLKAEPFLPEKEGKTEKYECVDKVTHSVPGFKIWIILINGCYTFVTMSVLKSWFSIETIPLNYISRNALDYCIKKTGSASKTIGFVNWSWNDSEGYSFMLVSPIRLNTEVSMPKF